VFWKMQYTRMCFFEKSLYRTQLKGDFIIGHKKCENYVVGSSDCKVPNPRYDAFRRPFTSSNGRVAVN